MQNGIMIKYLTNVFSFRLQLCQCAVRCSHVFACSLFRQFALASGFCKVFEELHNEDYSMFSVGRAARLKSYKTFHSFVISLETIGRNLRAIFAIITGICGLRTAAAVLGIPTTIQSGVFTNIVVDFVITISGDRITDLVQLGICSANHAGYFSIYQGRTGPLPLGNRELNRGDSCVVKRNHI